MQSCLVIFCGARMIHGQFIFETCFAQNVSSCPIIKKNGFHAKTYVVSCQFHFPKNSSWTSKNTRARSTCKTQKMPATTEKMHNVFMFTCSSNVRVLDVCDRNYFLTICRELIKPYVCKRKSESQIQNVWGPNFTNSKTTTANVDTNNRTTIA